MCQKVAKKPASWNFHFPKMFEKWFYFPTKIHQDVDRRGCVVRLKFAIEVNSDTIIRTHVPCDRINTSRQCTLVKSLQRIQKSKTPNLTIFMHARALKMTITDSVIHGPCQPASLTITPSSLCLRRTTPSRLCDVQFTICHMWKDLFRKGFKCVWHQTNTTNCSIQQYLVTRAHTKKRCFPLWVKEENHLFHVCLGSNI